MTENNQHQYPILNSIDVLNSSIDLANTRNFNSNNEIMSAIEILCGEVAKQVLQKYGVLDDNCNLIFENKTEGLTELEKKWGKVPLLKLKSQEEFGMTLNEVQEGRILGNVRNYWILNPRSDIEKALDIKERISYYVDENNCIDLEKNINQISNTHFTQIFEINMCFKKKENEYVGIHVINQFFKTYNVSQILIGDRIQDYDDFEKKIDIKLI